MTLRFESATMVGRRCLLLSYLVPWLKNIELVDVSSDVSLSAVDQVLDDCMIPENTRHLRPVTLQGDGWGSASASHMVLNNLFYLTVKVRGIST